MRFSDVSISKKLTIGFVAVFSVVLISSIVTVWQVQQVAEIERVNLVAKDTQNTLNLARGDLEAARAAVRKLVLTGGAKDLEKTQDNLDRLHKHVALARESLSREHPAFLSDLALYEAKIDAYVKDAIQPEMKLSGDPSTRAQAAALVVSPTSGPLAMAADETFTSLSAKIDAWSGEWTARAQAAMSRIETVIILSAVVMLLVGGLKIWLLGRVVVRPLSVMTASMDRLAAGDHTITIDRIDQQDEVGRMARAIQVFKEAGLEKLSLEEAAVDAQRSAEAARARNEDERAKAGRLQANVVHALASGLERLAEGNLICRIEDPFTTEYEKLRGDFNAAMGKLQLAMQTVAANTAAIRSGANEIATASDDLSKRTEQQAASLEETAAALDEITSTVKKTSDGAIHAQAIVSKAKTDAERSGEVVRRAVTAMSAIETSAHKVSQIIGVIDEIAFQTNLLALNAGVEAARAGEAGRGFAVVASEVRGLAQRSAEAAKEIKALISESERQVEEGVELIGLTGTALERIVVQVGEINTIVSDITTSTREQATALQEVNTAVNQMDQVTQQNAAMVEQSTAASHSLTGETEELSQLIGRFQVGQVESGSVVSRQAPLRIRSAWRSA